MALVIVATATVGNEYQIMTVVDPKLQAMSVYRIDLASGIVHFLSERRIHWDLQMSEFNGKSPLPRDIRAQLELR